MFSFLLLPRGSTQTFLGTGKRNKKRAPKSKTARFRVDSLMGLLCYCDFNIGNSTLRFNIYTIIQILFLLHFIKSFVNYKQQQTINAEFTVVQPVVIAAGRRGCISFVLDFFASFFIKKKRREKRKLCKKKSTEKMRRCDQVRGG